MERTKTEADHEASFTDRQSKSLDHGSGRQRGKEYFKDGEGGAAWAHLQVDQEEQLVHQQDDCHRCLPTTAPHSEASTCRSRPRLALPGSIAVEQCRRCASSHDEMRFDTFSCHDQLNYHNFCLQNDT